MRIEAENPTIGYPSLQVSNWITGAGISHYERYSENQAFDCGGLRNDFGFVGRCWRESDSSDKRFHVSLSKAPTGCPQNFPAEYLQDCPSGQTALDICNVV